MPVARQFKFGQSDFVAICQGFCTIQAVADCMGNAISGDVRISILLGNRGVSRNTSANKPSSFGTT
jgi:hypothetical protein